MRVFIAILSAVLMMILYASHSVAEDIIDKNDAKQMFVFGYDEWSVNVDNAVRETKHSRKVIESKTETTLIYKAPMGTMIITPSYRNAKGMEKPYKITVSAIMDSGVSILMRALSDNALKDIIKDTKNKMLPEYSVMTKIIKYDDTVKFRFVIFERGVHPLVDDAVDSNDGCWEDCIETIK